jgi:hypothetical protein
LGSSPSLHRCITRVNFVCRFKSISIQSMCKLLNGSFFSMKKTQLNAGMTRLPIFTKVSNYQNWAQIY